MLATASVDTAADACTKGMPAMAISLPEATRKVSGKSVPMYSANTKSSTTHPDARKQLHLMNFSMRFPPFSALAAQKRQFPHSM